LRYEGRLEGRGIREHPRDDKLFRVAFESSPSGMVMVDRDGAIILANREIERLFGYSQQELLGQSIDMLVPHSMRPAHPEYRANFVAHQQSRAMGTGRDLVGRRRDGSEIPVEIGLNPIETEDGRYVLASVVDLSARKRAEERFRQLTENMKEVFFVVDSQFRETLYISPGYEQVWGRSCDSLRERPSSFLDAVGEESLGALRANIANVQAGEAGEVVFSITRPDGEQRWIHTHTVPVRNAAGEVYRIAGVSMDITDRHRAQHALEESEARYRLLSETSFDGIAISEDGIILEANTGYAQMFGHTREQVIGMSILEFVADESLGETRGRIERNEPGTYELLAKHRDGRKLRLEATANAYRAGERVRRVTAIRDVSERHSLERQYRQAQKMEAVGRLAGGVAHDFNNLLTVISSYTSLLLTERGLTEPMRDDLTEIGKAAESAATLTRQLLAFSRQQVLQPKPLDLNEVVRGAGKMLQRVIGEDIEMRTAFEEAPCRVRADAGQLEQVVMNMAVNARDAMPDGGSLTLETANVELTDAIDGELFAVTPGPYVQLSISDSGTGMDEETRAQIFEPFFTTKEPGKGTGLGLSTVYGIVKQSAGYVSVDSQLGKGTTFKIYLPRIDSLEEPVESVRAVGTGGGAETVLLVEDVSALRDIVRRVLEHKGYTVLDAADAKSALAASASYDGPIHLLLTDVVLPGTGGRELAEQLRRERPELRVLFTSGYTDDAVVRRGIIERDFAFMQKPFTPETVERRVREVLDATITRSGD
jgi:two-component system cell cycle sensor histidine kinase/response regulator CckA